MNGSGAGFESSSQSRWNGRRLRSCLFFHGASMRDSLSPPLGGPLPSAGSGEPLAVIFDRASVIEIPVGLFTQDEIDQRKVSRDVVEIPKGFFT